MLLISGLAALSVGLTLLSVFGVMPWLSVTASFGGQPLPEAGMLLQLFFTGLMVALCFFLPANGRVMQLERSHRRFELSMEDVARAYALCHKADREGVFTLSSEFDAVRERILHLRQHPDLTSLEPEILEVAAQMSFQSRDLAEIYSDEKVDRAQAALKQRQAEIDEFRDRLSVARSTVEQIKRWMQDVEADEKTISTQLGRLEDDLKELLPALGLELEDKTRNVVPMAMKPAAE